MSDLIEFLRARLDEDEEAARNFDWIDTTKTPEPSPYQKSAGITPGPPQTWELEPSPEYITVYIDPARVLREVEAKRRMIETVLDYESSLDHERGCVHDPEEIAAGGCDRLPDRIEAFWVLALPYSDHPDYREEWRP